MAIVVVTQSEGWNTLGVATPTEIVRNITISNESSQGIDDGQETFQTYNQSSAKNVDAESNLWNIENVNTSTASKDTQIMQLAREHTINMDFDTFSISYVGMKYLPIMTEIHVL